jgi:hypothetical protein
MRHNGGAKCKDAKKRTAGLDLELEQQLHAQRDLEIRALVAFPREVWEPAGRDELRVASTRKTQGKGSRKSSDLGANAPL